jgi:hypothetical protein
MEGKHARANREPKCPSSSASKDPHLAIVSKGTIDAETTSQDIGRGRRWSDRTPSMERNPWLSSTPVAEIPHQVTFTGV